jgi:hypothetical protein
VCWSKAVVPGVGDDRLVSMKCVSFDKKCVRRHERRARAFRDALSSSPDDVPMFISVVPSLEKENFWIHGRRTGGAKLSF